MKADVKSSGIAAPVAQSRQPGGLGISLASFSDDLKNGANAFMLMLERVREIGDDTVLSLGEHTDGRDYRAISFELEAAIYANLMGSTKATREGFLRALADYLSTVEDGAYPGVGWNHDRALHTTAAAFVSEGEAA